MMTEQKYADQIGERSFFAKALRGVPYAIFVQPFMQPLDIVRSPRKYVKCDKCGQGHYSVPIGKPFGCYKCGAVLTALQR